MLLREIMKPAPLTAKPTDTLGDAFRAMHAAGVRHLPVVGDGKLVGMLSERDVLRFRARIDFDHDWWREPVATAMQAPVQTAGPADSLSEAAGRLAAARIGALPIVELGRLVGLVTVTDVLAAEVTAAMR